MARNLFIFQWDFFDVFSTLCWGCNTNLEMKTCCFRFLYGTLLQHKEEEEVVVPWNEKHFNLLLPTFFREFALQKKDWMTQKVFFRVLQQVLDFNTFFDSTSVLKSV